jgi:hypothetical protein
MNGDRGGEMNCRVHHMNKGNLTCLPPDLVRKSQSEFVDQLETKKRDVESDRFDIHGQHVAGRVIGVNLETRYSP